MLCIPCWWQGGTVSPPRPLANRDAILCCPVASLCPRPPQHLFEELERDHLKIVPDPAAYTELPAEGVRCTPPHSVFVCERARVVPGPAACVRACCLHRLCHIRTSVGRGLRTTLCDHIAVKS